MNSSEAIILHRKIKIVTQLIYARFPVLLLHSLENGRCSCKNHKCMKSGQHALVPRGKASYDLQTVGRQLIGTPKAGIGYLRMVPEFVPGKARLVYFRTMLDVVPETAWALAEPAAAATQVTSIGVAEGAGQKGNGASVLPQATMRYRAQR